ncbi:3-methyl-2-oxobutanoate hydroxymethyltransferase [Pelagibacterales bacterium SAG-MED31]|nr:3-methyl-2-oxobutanoate hydroxymethyltransferase [Pelagibacterales bacterium SAG-MED31]
MLKINYKKLLMKKNKEPITCLTAYSKPIAKILDGKVDLILIGDSLGTTIYGMDNTRGVTVEMMKNHGKAVVMNSKFSMTIVDMPYKTYRNKNEALKNAREILAFTKADFIKIETDKKNVNVVKHLTKNRVKVISHIGITPQKFSDFSKIKSVGKKIKDENNLIILAKELENAGSKMIVLECINTDVSRKITSNLSIPTIGIGSSKYCDGQVLVIDDILNLNSISKKPKFIKSYTNIEKNITRAVNTFIREVKNKTYPSKKHSY